MSQQVEGINFYADQECTKPISNISWNSSIKIKLADGTEQILPNTARGGDSAIAVIWVKNETEFDYGITEISFSDSRVQVLFSSSWVYPNRPTQISIVFHVPAVPTKSDIVEAGTVIVHGYFIYKSIAH